MNDTTDSTTESPLEGLRRSTARLRESLRQARAAARGAADEIRDTAARARQEADQATARLGLSRDRGPVIDVGVRPSLTQQLVQTGAAALALALMVGGLASLGMFLLQFIVAILLVTRVLGFRVDLPASTHG